MAAIKAVRSQKGLGRGARLLGALVLPLAVLPALAIGTQQAGASTPTLAGEQFVAGDGDPSTTFAMTNVICATSPSGASSFDFSGHGTATGPIPGTFDESGSVSFVGSAPSPLTMTVSFSLYDTNGNLAAQGSVSPGNVPVIGPNGDCGVPPGQMHVVGPTEHNVTFVQSGTTEQIGGNLTMSNDNPSPPPPGKFMIDNFIPVPPPQGTVAGTVTGTGGVLLAGSGVAAVPTGHQFSNPPQPDERTAGADPSSGQYSLSLSPGTWDMIGYANLGQFTSNPVTGVVVTAGQTITENFVIRVATVSGTVTDRNGTAVPNSGVVACPAPATIDCPNHLFAFADPSGHYTLDVPPGSYNVAGFALAYPSPTVLSPVVQVTVTSGQAITENFVLPLPPVAGTPISMGPQAMEGDLKVAPGTTLKTGYDFTMPGSHPAATVSFVGPAVNFQATCVSGTGGGTITVPMSDASYPDPQNSSAWYPSGDQSNAATYQGSTTVPDLCGGGLVRLQKGGTFTAGVASTDTTNKVNVRWHYSANNSAGGWSGTLGVIPS